MFYINKIIIFLIKIHTDIAYICNMKTDENSLITVLISSFTHEVYLAKNELELQNIVSFVFDDNLNSTIGTSFVEGYKLKVKTKDFEKAKTILSISKT